MSSYHLAQLNIARMKFTAEAPEMADFMNNLDKSQDTHNSHH